MAADSEGTGLASSLTDLMTSLAVIFILLLVASHNNEQQEFEEQQDNLASQQQTLAQAVQAGATGFTHLANGCPRDLDRHDNILWRAFETPGLTISLIPDGRSTVPTFYSIGEREGNAGQPWDSKL